MAAGSRRQHLSHSRFPIPESRPLTVSTFASPAAPRPGEVAGTLRLLAYLAVSVALMVADHRGDWLGRVRAAADTLAQPLWQIAGLPSRLGRSMREDVASRAILAEDNRRLRNELLVMGARQARLQVEAQEVARLRGLLAAAEGGSLEVQLAQILDIDLDPSRQRLVLGTGSRGGARVGQSVLDAGGLLGQVVSVTPATATVLLLTDLDHAVPVIVARNGVRLVAFGTGRSDRLELRNIPVSSDIRPGDVLVTSGLGARFPPGFPVGTVVELRPDDSHAFLVGDLAPAAQLDRGRDVLLLLESRDSGVGSRDSEEQRQQQGQGAGGEEVAVPDAAREGEP